MAAAAKNEKLLIKLRGNFIRVILTVVTIHNPAGCSNLSASGADTEQLLHASCGSGLKRLDDPAQHAMMKRRSSPAMYRPEFATFADALEYYVQ